MTKFQSDTATGVALLIIIALAPFIFMNDAEAACKWVWVDHDNRTSTPAIRKQVCDSIIDPPAINVPSVRPIQQPRIQPIQPIGVPPIGTTRCRIEAVYNESTRRWENRRVCS